MKWKHKIKRCVTYAIRNQMFFKYFSKKSLRTCFDRAPNWQYHPFRSHFQRGTDQSSRGEKKSIFFTVRLFAFERNDKLENSDEKRQTIN